MTYIDTQIQELLGRNLFLAKKEKNEILAESQETKKELLPLLEAMDEKQTEIFRGAVQRNPDFFEDWGNAIEQGRDA